MTWERTGGKIVTGVVDIVTGIVETGKVIKDSTSIKTNSGGESEMKRGLRL